MYKLAGATPLAGGSPSWEGFLSLVHPDDRPAVEKAVERALGDTRRCTLEHRLQDVDGRVRFVHQYIEAIVTVSGEYDVRGTIRQHHREQARSGPDQLPRDLRHAHPPPEPQLPPGPDGAPPRAQREDGDRRRDPLRRSGPLRADQPWPRPRDGRRAAPDGGRAPAELRSRDGLRRARRRSAGRVALRRRRVHDRPERQAREVDRADGRDAHPALARGSLPARRAHDSPVGEHRDRDLAPGRLRPRHAHHQRRVGDELGEGERGRQLPLLRREDEPGRDATARPRGRSHECAAERRVRARVPAAGRRGDGAARGGRGARPVEPSDARPRAAERLHPGRGGVRPRERARRVGAPPGLRAAAPLGRGRPAALPHVRERLERSVQPGGV